MMRVTLADVLEFIEVKEHLDYESVFRNYTYRVHFQFLPRAAYKQDSDVRPKQILRSVSCWSYRIANHKANFIFIDVSWLEAI